MNPIKATITAVLGILVPLLTALADALKVPDTPARATTIRVAAVAIVAACFGGAAYLGGVTVDWRTLLPLLGELLAPVP